MSSFCCKTGRATSPSSPSIRLTLTGCAAVLLCVMTAAVFADAEAALEPTTTVEGITEYRLDNGLQVLLFPDQSKPTVTVNVTYLVGSRHEGRGEKGMAHLLEHMVFKGTPTFDNIWGVLEDHGARFNGSTWTDRTNYFETLPATDENLEFALHLEADRMVNSTIDADEFAKEMTVVRNEFEIGENNPANILSERMMSTAYLWHSYGNTTIGNRSDILRVPVENLRRFYEKYYQPDNAMLVVAGKFEPAMALALVEKHFGAIPRPTRVLEETHTEEPTQDGARLVTLKRAGDVAATGLMYHVPAGSHADFAAVQVLEDVLTNQPAGRLYKALVEPGLASSVSGAAYPWAEPTILELGAEVRLDQDVQQVLDMMTGIVESVADADITDEEVERVKTRRLKYIKMALTNSGRIGVQLSEWAALGDWRMFFVHRDRLKEVTTDDVRRVAQTYLVESNRTAGLFIPAKDPVRAEVPPTPVVAEIVDGYQGTETIAMGETFDATPENIEQRTTRQTLASGIQVALLPKETRGNAVRARFRFHFGTEAALTGHATALELIPRMMMRGTTERDFQALRDEIDRLQSRIMVYGGAGEIGGYIESDRANIMPAIELLGEILQKPMFSSEEFGVVMNEELSQLEEGLSDPRQLGGVAMSRAMSPWPADSFFYVPTLEERLERSRAVTIDQLKDLYGRFYGASDVEVAVVGDFDAGELTATLEAVLGDWKSPSPYERIVQPFRPTEAQSAMIDTPDKPNAFLAVGTTFAMRDDDPDYPAMTMAVYLMGQSTKSRLINRMRHEGGLSYFARSFFGASAHADRAYLSTVAACGATEADEGLEAMHGVIRTWLDEGVTEEELTEGKVSYALGFTNRLADDGRVVGMLIDGLEIGRTLEYQVGVQAGIQELTLDDIKGVLDEYLGNAPTVEVKAADPQPAAAEGGDLGAAQD